MVIVGCREHRPIRPVLDYECWNAQFVNDLHSAPQRARATKLAQLRTVASNEIERIG
jgi:hypothetical protein